MASVGTAVLLSGGMDSIALTYSCRPQLAITVDYGQLPAAGEVRAAAAVCEALEIRHEVVRVDLRLLGSGDLAGGPALGIAPVPEWWPFRNQMLITLAAMRVVKEDIRRLLLGTVKGDQAHADGRREFVDAMSAVLRVQEGQLSVEAPAIDISAADFIRNSGVPTEVLAWAHSCHVAEYACGVCRGCFKHYQTLEALGLDPY